MLGSAVLGTIPILMKEGELMTRLASLGVLSAEPNLYPPIRNTCAYITSIADVCVRSAERFSMAGAEA
jgi:hypothetical protein